jgi:predicted phosphate transport protein (TIGR00153 family)
MPAAVDGDFRRRVDDAVLVIFTLVAESIGWATVALLDLDVERANTVVADDAAIDERCEALVALVKERLSSAPPGPDELEDLIAILQIVPELERSADLAEHIAQRAQRNLGSVIPPKARGLIEQMSEIAVQMWHVVGRAYRQRSRDAVFDLREADDELDELASRLVSDAVLDHVDAPAAAELALLARFYERIGDHAVNLARRVETMGAPRRLSAMKRLSTTLVTRVPSEKRGRFQHFLSSLTRFRLVPTDEGFFDLFVAAASNARECADELDKMIASFSDIETHYEKVKTHERRGDELTVELLRRLDASFVTPYDREDIHALAEELDDVVDEMFSAASLLDLVHPETSLPEVAEIAEVLVAMTDELVALMTCLTTNTGARHRLERIEHLERQGDVIYRRSIGRLFNGEYDALEVMKWKDIVQSLEASLNAIEDVSDVVESILVKNS